MSKKLVFGVLLTICLSLNITMAVLQCERIAIPVCQGLGYNLTAMPNLAGHTTQHEAEIMMNELEPILESRCSKQARFLFCATMFPLCSPEVPRPVPACRNLCETVRSDCSEIPGVWPKFLDCDSLPQPGNNELCMQIPQERDVEQQPSSHQAPNLWPWLNLKLPNTHLFKLPSVATCPVNFTLAVDECVPLCRADALFTARQKKAAETWILVLAAICFLFTLFSLVTFWTETTRFGFPERPVLFLTLCYNLLSICYLERIVFHNRGLEIFDGESGSGVCEVNPPCLASYITTSYLTLSAASWWLIFGLCWYLSTEKQWSSEALERKSGVFHVLAWVPPLAPPIGALLWGAVRPHELTAMCTAPGFTEIPALILLLMGTVLIVLSAVSLHRLQHSCHYDKLQQMMTRILIFGGIYFVPATLAVVLSFFEHREPLVKICQPGDACAPPEKASSAVSLARLFFILFGGSLTGIWVWSRKTCNSCRSRISATPAPSCVVIKSTTASLPKYKSKGSIASASVTAPLFSAPHQTASISAHSRV
ncbi:frizzled-3 [Phlebotomus papatasi]|uniref:frizzled-3 n=1 Tax=Phlebotomus papatasi TaxID=29031 RepID=UPI002483A74C|nr:frizzled-3 [Phlebotomus papatasi]